MESAAPCVQTGCGACLYGDAAIYVAARVLESGVGPVRDDLPKEQAARLPEREEATSPLARERDHFLRKAAELRAADDRWSHASACLHEAHERRNELW